MNRMLKNTEMFCSIISFHDKQTFKKANVQNGYNNNKKIRPKKVMKGFFWGGGGFSP